MEKYIDNELSEQLKQLYSDMETNYAKVADLLNFSCEGCPDNCCDSYFQHHTYLEWAYLWEGLSTLPESSLNSIRKRAEENIRKTEAMPEGEYPQIMCPLNENGLCSLYLHRLMICRMHGVPTTLSRSDGQTLSFPGCFRCQEITAEQKNVSTLERTDLYIRLRELEFLFLGVKRHYLPKVNLTLAEMIVTEPKTGLIP
jgi:hypothetical protein